MLWSSKRLIVYLLLRSVLRDVTAVSMPPVRGTEARILHQPTTSHPQAGPREEELNVTKIPQAGPREEELSVTKNPQAGPREEELSVTKNPQAGPREEDLSVTKNTQAGPRDEELSVTKNTQAGPREEELSGAENPQAGPREEDLSVTKNPQAGPREEELSVTKNPQAGPREEDLSVTKNTQAGPRDEELSVTKNTQAGPREEELSGAKNPQAGPREEGLSGTRKETDPQNCNTTRNSLTAEYTSIAGTVAEYTFRIGNESLSTETSTNISSVTTDVSSTSQTRNRLLTPEDGMIGREGYILGKRISIWGVNPVLTVVGFVTNCLSARVIHDMLRAGTSSVYLLGLAVVDAANCFVGMYLTVTSILEDIGYKSVRDFTTRAYPYAWILVSGSVARLSATFTAILTVERFLAVCFPFYVKRSCFSRYPKIPIALSLLLVPGYFIISVLKYASVEVTDPKTGATWVEVTQSDIGIKYVEFFRVWTSAGVLITHMVPLVVITILNGCIVGKLICMRRLRSRMTSSKSAQADKNQVTRILVSLAFLFTLTNIPVVVFLVFMFLDSDFTPRGSERYLYLLLMELNNTLVTLNSAANFFVAVIASGNFRMYLKARFCFREGQASDKDLQHQTCSTNGTKDVTSNI